MSQVPTSTLLKITVLVHTEDIYVFLLFCFVLGFLCYSHAKIYEEFKEMKVNDNKTRRLSNQLTSTHGITF